MRILVSGGTGTVGTPAVRRLVDQGHELTVIGRSQTMIPDAEYQVCNVTDYDCVREAARGKDAIVHLAAIPSPVDNPPQQVYDVNTTGTFNMFQAATEEGIKRVVVASSINALGYYFGKVKFPIEYFPIDEQHPTYTTDSYSFSKQVIEEIGRYFWRREGITSVALRLPAVVNQQHFMGERMSDFAADNPELWRSFARDNFWTLIDDRDSALAIDLSLQADIAGAYAIYVNDWVNFAGRPAEWLIAKHFPEVTQRKQDLAGDDALVSNRLAHHLIGYEPEHSWAEIVRSDENPFKGKAIELW